MTSRNAMLTVLVLVGIISWIDRQIFASLMEPLKLEFRFSDTQLGLLSGTAFGVVYAMAALPLAWLADTRSKKSILIVSVLGFSVATLLGGFALGFWTLFLTRMLVGIG